MTDAPVMCPCCSSGFHGEPIPTGVHSKYVPDAVPLNKLLAEIDEDRRLVVAWECSNCGHCWPRE